TGDEALACGAGAEAARLALLRRLRRAFPLLPRGLGPLRGRPAGQQLQDFVERSRSPDDLRRIWKEIEGLRILDPSCGDGAWLCGCLDGLTTVGMACLHRMRVWIDTQQRTAARRRPEMLADFRAVLERAAELARTGGEERFVVETILLRCLHGV